MRARNVLPVRPEGRALAGADAGQPAARVHLDTVIDASGGVSGVHLHIEVSAAGTRRPGGRPLARAIVLAAALVAAGILIASHASDAAWDLVGHVADLTLGAIG